MYMTPSCIGRVTDNRGNTAPDSPTLHDAIRSTIHAGMGGTVQHLADATGLPAKSLYRWATDPANPSDDGRKLPAEAIVPLARATGRLDVVRFLAREVDHLLVPMPPAVVTTANLLACISRVTVETGDVQRETGATLHDGAVTCEEAARVVEECEQAMRELAALRAAALQAMRPAPALLP
jgi:hypothetical protein